MPSINSELDTVEPLSGFLFQDPAPDGRSLFTDMSDLYGELVKVGGEENEASRSFLQQIIRGTRGCPSNLKSVLTDATKRRLATRGQGGPVQDEWSLRLEQLIAVHNRSRGEALPLDAEVLFYELLKRSDEAVHQYIITSETAELSNSFRAEALQRILIRRLGLYDAAAKDKPTFYTFCLPDGDVARRWWRQLFIEVTSQAGFSNPVGKGLRPDVANARLRDLDSADDLRVFAIPRYVCACAPTVVFDPDKRDAGFNLYWHGSRNVSVAKMNDGSLRAWQQGVYVPLELDQIDRVRVHWSMDCLNLP